MKSKNVLKSLVKGLSLCFLVKAYFFTSAPINVKPEGGGGGVGLTTGF